MAWYNPQRVQFNPNAQIAQQAGAVGNFLQQNAKTQFEENLRQQQAQLLADKFGYTKQRDGVKDNQWLQRFKQKNKEIADNSTYHNTVLKNHATDAAATNDFRNKELGLKKTLYDNTNKKYDAKIAADKLKAEQQRNQNIIKGEYLAQQNPSFAQQAGAIDVTKDISVNPQMQSPYNPYIQMGAGISPVAQPDFIPKVNEKLTYNKDSLANLGASGIPMPTASNTTSSTYKDWKFYNDSLSKQGKEPISYQQFYDQKQNAKKFGVGLRDSDEIKNRKAKLMQKYGIDNLDNIDINTLNPQAKADLGQLVTEIEQAQKDKMPEWAKKKAVEYSKLVYASDNISKLLKTNNTGLLDNALVQVNNYLGLGNDTKLIKTAMGESNYALFRNTMLKIMSGTAVSSHEAVRFQQGFGSLYNADKVVATKMYNNMGALRAEMQTLKDSYNPTVFNYRYGHLLRSVDTAMAAMESSLGGNISGKEETWKSIANPTQRTNQTITVDDAQKYGISFE